MLECMCLLDSFAICTCLCLILFYVIMLDCFVWNAVQRIMSLVMDLT